MWGRVIIVWADSPHPAFLFILQELQGSSHNQISLCDLAVSQNRFGITFWGGFSVNSPPILANLSFRAWIFHWRFTKGANHWALDFDHRPWPVFQKVPPRTFISPHGQAVLQREGPWRVLRLQGQSEGEQAKKEARVESSRDVAQNGWVSGYVLLQRFSVVSSRIQPVSRWCSADYSVVSSSCGFQWCSPVSSGFQ